MINQQALKQSRFQPKSNIVSIPAPVGGLNTRDALASMPPTDAVYLDNWFPTIGQCEVRKGYTEHATGVSNGNVDTVMEYHAGAVRKLLASSPTNIYDATSTGAASSLASGFTSGQWQTVNFNGIAVFVNGSDTPQQYNGSTISAMSWTGSGLSPADLIGVNVFKDRLFFWEDASQDFWYASVNAIAGTLTKFPLSRVAQFGGNLLSMATWTHDGGDGLDDYAVFIMTSGDVIVYQGTDPGNANTWGLIGIYRIGPPTSIRGVVKSGGDLLVMTESDYVSMSQVLKTGQLGTSTKISGYASTAARDFAGQFGFQAIICRRNNMAIFNVPATAGAYHQHVLNLLTGAWTRFTGIPARAWGTYNNNIYFGSTNGKVYLSCSANTDDGGVINADGRQAWNLFDVVQRKRLTGIRPIVSSQGPINYEIGVGFDFKTALVTSAISTTPQGSAWDVSPWDTSPWSASESIDLGWRAKGGSGYHLSPRLRVSAEQEIAWLRTDLRLEQGINQ